MWEKRKYTRKVALSILLAAQLLLGGCATEEEHVEPSVVSNNTEEKQDIIFAMQWMDDTVKQAIVEFNRNHSDYRIVPKTCTEWEYYDDYRSKTDMEIAAGEGADIFILPWESYESYRQKGILLDLAPYFAKDDTVDMDDFVEKAWSRYIEGESLYAVPTGFVLSTVVGRQQDFQGKTGWTMEEMMAFAEANPQVKELLNGYEKENVLLYCCQGMLTGKEGLELENVKFEEESFLNILKFADKYGRKETVQDGQLYHMMRDESLLMLAGISNIEDVERYQALLNDEICVVGYPSEQPTPCYMLDSEVLAVRADTPYADQIWEFIKILLSESYQRQQFKFPVLERILEERFQDAVCSKEEELEVAFTVVVDNQYVDVMNTTSEDVELMKSMIEESVPYPYEMDAIIDMILEEASGYFNGQKSAEEAARIIQNRVQLYIEEQL